MDLATRSLRPPLRPQWGECGGLPLLEHLRRGSAVVAHRDMALHGPIVLGVVAATQPGGAFSAAIRACLSYTHDTPLRVAPGRVEERRKPDSNPGAGALNRQLQPGGRMGWPGSAVLQVRRPLVEILDPAFRPGLQDFKEALEASPGIVDDHHIVTREGVAVGASLGGLPVG